VIVSVVGRLQLQPWPSFVCSPLSLSLPSGKALIIDAYVLDEQQSGTSPKQKRGNAR
jgi:hypothetical protein